MRNQTVNNINIESFVRFLLEVLVAFLVIALAGTIANSCMGDVEATPTSTPSSLPVSECADDDDACWQRYSDAAEKGQSEAGGLTLEPRGTPPKSWNDDKNKSPKDGIEIGFQWPKDPDRFLERMKSRDSLYGPWFQKYRGNMSRGEAVVISVTEAIKPLYSCTWDSRKWECGVMGVKRGSAKSCNCNVCHPECAISCSMRLRNLNIQQAYKAFSSLSMAPELDQYLLAGMFSSPGTGYARELISKSGALEVMDGKLIHDAPYFYLTEWMGKHTSTGLSKITMPFKPKNNWHRTAIRVGLRLGFVRMAMGFHGVYDFADLPRGDKETVQVPSYLPPYPGNLKHGRCWLPEFKNMVRKRP